MGANSSVVSEDDDHMDMLDDDMTMLDIGDHVTLSATSHQEASQVLQQWKSDHHGMMEDTFLVITSSTPTKGAAGVAAAAAAISDNDEDHIPEDMAILMEVDEAIGSNFLNEEVFGGGACTAVGPIPAAAAGDPFCPSPMGPLDEFHGASFGAYYYGYYDDDERSLAPFLDEDGQDAVVMALDSVLEDETMTSAEPNVDPEQYRKLLEKLVESMKKSEETRKSLTMKTPKTEKYSRSKTVSGVLTSIEKSSRQLQNYLKSVQKATSSIG
jgi:hypothetical protein